MFDVEKSKRVLKPIFDKAEPPQIEEAGMFLVADDDVKWKPITIEVDTLPTQGEPFTYYLVNNNGRIATYYFTDSWCELSSEIIEEKEIGDLVFGDNLTSEVVVISRYGGTSWTQVNGAIYGAGDDIANVGSVAQSMLNTTFVGSSATSTNAGAHTHPVNGFADCRVGTTTASDGSALKAGSGLTATSQENTTTHTHTVVPTGSITYQNANGTSITINGYVRMNGYATYIWKRLT